MRALLGILLCVLFLQSQVFALSGGPDYNQGSGNLTASILGTYGGVLVEQSSGPIAGGEDLPGGVTITDSNGGSVAVFSLGIPASGLATGTILVFTRGNVYPGTITGIAGAEDDSTFKGIIEASFNYNYQLASTTEKTDADGNVTTTTTFETKSATVISNGTLDAAISTTRNAATSSTTMIGTSTLLVGGLLNPSIQVDYSVFGYRQSATAL